MVVGWMFSRVGFHATRKGAELSYNLGCLLTVVLILPVCPDCPVCPGRQGLSVPIYEVYLHCPHYKLPSL